MISRTAQIVGWGRHVPERRVSSAELEERLGLEPGWIVRRTGIASRRWAEPDETLTEMARRASVHALSNAGIAAADLGLILLATSTPDQLLPPSAPLLAHRLGASCGAVDVTGACSGFIYALSFADAFVRAHSRPALVVAANILSRRINIDERGSAVLFADGAGAAVLAPSNNPNHGALGLDLSSSGVGWDLVGIPGGGSNKPFDAAIDPSEFLMTLRDGRQLYAQALDMMTGCAQRALAAAQLGSRDITLLAPHQANGRLVEQVRLRLGIGADRLAMSYAEYGNSSAATIPLTISLAIEEKPLRPGDKLLMTAAGAGLAGGALVFGF